MIDERVQIGDKKDGNTLEAPEAMGGGLSVDLCIAGIIDPSTCDGVPINGCDLGCSANKTGDQSMVNTCARFGGLTLATVNHFGNIVAFETSPDKNFARECDNVKAYLQNFEPFHGQRVIVAPKNNIQREPTQASGTTTSQSQVERKRVVAPPIAEIKNLPVINEKYKFDTFTKCSTADHLAVITVEPHARVNAGSTVCIIGGKQSGKTHLLTAMYQEFVANNPSKKCIFLTGSAFKELYSGAYGHGWRDDFGRVGVEGFSRYFQEDMDAIFIDNIDDLAEGSKSKFLNIIGSQREDQLIAYTTTDAGYETKGVIDIRLKLELPATEKARRDRLLNIVKFHVNNMPQPELGEYEDLAERVLKQLRPRLAEGDTINVDSFINMLLFQIGRNIGIEERADQPIEQFIMFKKNKDGDDLLVSDMKAPFSESYVVEKPVDIKKIIDYAISCNIVPASGSPKKATNNKPSKRPARQSSSRSNNTMTSLRDLFSDIKES